VPALYLGLEDLKRALSRRTRRSLARLA
jgi:hypothetical protein